MEKDKQVMLLEGEQALVRVGVQMGLVGKVLSDEEDAFWATKQVILQCEIQNRRNVIFKFDVHRTSLTILDMQITNLPPEIGQLINLTNLGLLGSSLTILPVEIGYLINLIYLDFDYNKLTVLPAEIGQLINLRKLYLRSNNLTYLPKEIEHLTNLRVLYLQDNPISDLEKEKIRLLLPNCQIEF